MLRAVLDTNVYVAALLSPRGVCAEVLRAVAEARFDAVVCPALLDELAGVLHRDKFAAYLTATDADEFVEWLSRAALHVPNPTDVHPLSPDPSDDYLIALAVASNAPVLVSGDDHLLGLDLAHPRVLSVAAFATVVRELP